MPYIPRPKKIKTGSSSIDALISFLGGDDDPAQSLMDTVNPAVGMARRVAKKILPKRLKDTFEGSLDEDSLRRLSMQKTSERGGVLVKNPGPVLKAVIQHLGDNKNLKVLDFGAGQAAQETVRLRKAGFGKARAIDLPENMKIGRNKGLEGAKYFDKTAVDGTNDVLMAQRVFNVQTRPEDLESLVGKIKSAIKKDGTVFTNFPLDPRSKGIANVAGKGRIKSLYGKWKDEAIAAYGEKGADRRVTERLRNFLQDHFNSVERVGGTATAPILKLTGVKER